MAPLSEMGLNVVLKWLVACDDPEHLLSVIETASACLGKAMRLSRLRWEAKTYRGDFAKARQERARQPRDRRRIRIARIAKNL